MKAVLFFWFAIAAFDAAAQGLPRNEAGQIEYTEIREVAGATKDQLFSRAQAWVAENFRSAQAVVQLSDREAGRLAGRGTLPFRGYGLGTVIVSGTTSFLFTIDAKDGRYRAVLGQFRWVHPTSPGVEYDMNGMISGKYTGKKKRAEAIAQMFDEDMRKMLSTLARSMASKPDDF